jgi:hypothetical protein
MRLSIRMERARDARGRRPGGLAGFKLIDPGGLLAEAECDLGMLMHEDRPAVRHDRPAAGRPRDARHRRLRFEV